MSLRPYNAVNEKFREGVSAWQPFHDSGSDQFPALFKRVMGIKSERALTPTEGTAHLVFLIRVFQSLKDEMVRAAALPMVSLPLWSSLSQGKAVQVDIRLTLG